MVLQIHLWTGIALGLYVVVIFVTGSVLVYRNELYRAFRPVPRIVTGSGAPLSDEALASAARRLYPDYEVTDLRHARVADRAVEITLKRDRSIKRRLLHPFTGEDLGDPLPAGYRAVAWMRDLHDNLLGGETGRQVNGAGSVLFVVLCLTGAFIWWPGIATWRRGLTVHWRSNWRRLNWRLHSALGFWFFVFMLMWGVTGTYLSFPSWFSSAFDAIQPYDSTTAGDRLVDQIQYWLAYLHFGRLGGRGIPGCGVGICDSISKATWAAAGLVPPIMFITGALMWWNRVLRPGLQNTAASDPADPDRSTQLE
jgi:uncharacterized iron-regulated membrane protein